MIVRFVAAATLALVLVSAMGSAALASPDPIVDTGIVERVECLFRVYINEGGESGLDCLT